MQKRIFLGNSNLIKSATKGKHVIAENYTGKSSDVCTSYVIKCKREKAVTKLYNEHYKYSLFSKLKDLKKYEILLNTCSNKEKLIEFINTPLINITTFKRFFQSFNN